ncbi:hypothetical protein UFOVP708_25 [uncultured Caudovirales phage]|uniref:Uncharacterized protein n=1 Tax=uncultured Caudovirales phage TaxID=2100421 RepID=A0A6J5NM78_9CAUD|nr:hypothetical protein UFOVP708_25 [uncultured Caudovirales phage]
MPTTVRDGLASVIAHLTEEQRNLLNCRRDGLIDGRTAFLAIRAILHAKQELREALATSA